jgi:signal transduction histidine kinase
VAFGVTGLVVAVLLAAVTYGLARSYLVDQRQTTAEQQTYVNARLARAVLRGPDPDIRDLLASLNGGTESSSVLRFQGETFATSVASGPDSIPDDLARTVSEGHAGHQRFRDSDGALRLAVGVPIAAADAAYFEVYALDELDRTLDLLARALAVGVAVAAVAAAAIGRVAASRVVRPLGPVADAAEQIAGGALDTRLTTIDDPDLQRLADAFNTMAAALEARIEREARFAADVSHELRSPLTAVAAALEVIEHRRGQLPPEVVDAFRVLGDKVHMFEQMVLDLLEISRVDAGTAALADDLIDLHHFLPRVLAHHGAAQATVTFVDGAPTRLVADRRRLAQAMGNLVDNAARYGGGTTAVTVASPEPDVVRFTFDDEGPGVPPAERDAIFGRFARGERGRRTGSTSGTGLGLALVSEHVRLHDGAVWVEDRPGGGARFVIDLPLRDEPDGETIA